MKRIVLFLCCLGLVACDDSHVIGKFLMHEDIIGETGQNGNTTYIKTTKYICGCFDDIEQLKSYKPSFIISELDAITVHDRNRDKKCTRLCQKEYKRGSL